MIIAATILIRLTVSANVKSKTALSLITTSTHVFVHVSVDPLPLVAKQVHSGAQTIVNACVMPRNSLVPPMNILTLTSANVFALPNNVTKQLMKFGSATPTASALAVQKNALTTSSGITSCAHVLANPLTALLMKSGTL